MFVLFIIFFLLLFFLFDFLASGNLVSLPVFHPNSSLRVPNSQKIFFEKFENPIQMLIENESKSNEEFQQVIPINQLTRWTP